MEASTTIRNMMAGNKIIVPSYQRAYSWDTPIEKSDRSTQTDVFLSDLEDWTVRSSEAVEKVKKNGHACAREGRHVRDWLK